MKIHKEGLKILRNEIIVFLILNLLAFNFLNYDIFYILMLITFILVVFSIYFFRIPKRYFEEKENTIYSPCDGKIVVIEQVYEKEYYNDQRIQVSIFMSPINIHNNLYPISGKIIYKKYFSGKYYAAWLPKASSDNESNSIVIANNKTSVLIKQIAGAIARRIVCYGNKNDDVVVSDELGFIKFGSRVDLFLPLNTKIEAKINQKVKGGEDVIARY